jgi:hypothetical protein
MIAEFDFTFASICDHATHEPKLTRETWDALRALIGPAFPTYDEQLEKKPYIFQTFVADVARVAALVPGITIKRLVPHGGDDLVAKLTRGLAAADRTDATFNARCSVHVPGLGLLMIDEVDLLADACTDHLNERLADGWRIVACCPQPDQRRPDYILGRSKPR